MRAFDLAVGLPFFLGLFQGLDLGLRQDLRMFGRPFFQTFQAQRLDLKTVAQPDAANSARTGAFLSAILNAQLSGKILTNTTKDKDEVMARFVADGPKQSLEIKRDGFVIPL